MKTVIINGIEIDRSQCAFNADHYEELLIYFDNHAEYVLDSEQEEYREELLEQFEFWANLLEKFDAPKNIGRKEYIETYDCLLEGVFVPDMTNRMQEKSMQQRLRDVEPDVFDSVVSQAQLDEWIYC